MIANETRLLAQTYETRLLMPLTYAKLHYDDDNNNNSSNNDNDCCRRRRLCCPIIMRINFRRTQNCQIAR